MGEPQNEGRNRWIYGPVGKAVLVVTGTRGKGVVEADGVISG